MIRWFFRGCLLAVLALMVLFALILLAALGVLHIPMQPLAITFCVIALILFAIPVVGGIAAKIFLKKFKKVLTEQAEMLGPTQVPTEITLTPLEKEWEKPERVTIAERQFGSLGFASIGEFNCKGIAGLRLHAFVKPTQKLYGIVYDHPKAGAWSDLVVYFEDGGALTVTNSSRAGTLDKRPGFEKVYDKTTDTMGLMGLFQQNRGDRMACELTADEFPARFEKAYRDEMVWLAKRGGPNREEVRRVAEQSGKTYSEQVIDTAAANTREQYREKLEVILRKKLLDDNLVTAARWDNVRDRLIFVHEHISGEHITNWFADLAEVPKEEGRDVWEKFRVRNAMLPVPEQYEFVAHLDEPVTCDVYARSEEAGS